MRRSRYVGRRRQPGDEQAEVRFMLGPTSENGEDDADLGIFVDRLAAAGSDRPTALARAHIRGTIGAGASPPGLRRLAEALAASGTELPPPPRRPSEDAGSVVDAMRDNALVVLEGFDPPAVAGAIGALLTDGRRVVVTGTTPDELASVRDALPAEVADRALDHLPATSPAELRELRRLLATSTPGRRARARQELPPEAALPPQAEVDELCARAVRPAGAAGIQLVPALLADLDHERRDAVTSVARCVDRALGALRPRADCEWTWALLSDLIYGHGRAAFDRLLENTAQAVTALERIAHAPVVTVTGSLPPDAADLLHRYLEFLGAGGRTRSFFRSSLQREVQSVLEQVRVGTRVPEAPDEVRRVIEHLALGERLGRADVGCAELGIPAPNDESALLELSEALGKVAAAARSVGALRHDVLFIAADSPLSVPDVDSAAQVAAAILDFADHGSAVAAGDRLNAMADELAGRCAVTAIAPEHEQAVSALRTRDAASYAAALEALGAARREARDEARRSALLRKLGEGAPRLAASWTALGEHDPAALGVASFLRMDALLSAVPPPDSADVVLVLGAARLGVERLLLAAVAPRMLAVLGPGERPDNAPTLLSVLQRASALVIRGRPSRGCVVQLTPGASRAVPARVGQAGA
jgi:hypothetical protein